MEPETVPDTQDYILWDKIGKSIGVYSGVYEYTQQIPGTNTEYTEYTRYLGICCALQAGFLQCNWFLLWSETQLKTTVTRKWNPCRAARSLALPLEAGRTLQTVLREGRSTLVLRTRSYNLFSESSLTLRQLTPSEGRTGWWVENHEFWLCDKGLGKS